VCAAAHTPLVHTPQKAIELLKATEVVVRTFERYKLWRDFNTVQREHTPRPAGWVAAAAKQCGRLRE
jgi:hypothetical protein